MLKLFRNSDHLTEGGTSINFDDWELIEVLDEEFGGEIDGDDAEVFDPVEAEELHSVFQRLLSHKIKYRILSKDDIRHMLEEKVSKVSTVLSLSRREAVILLYRYKWSVTRVHEEWLTREDVVRQDVGLFKNVCAWVLVKDSETDDVTCSICYESHGTDNTVAVSCGHQICLACWAEYVSAAINNGPECLALRCPEAGCEAAVGIQLIEAVSNQEDKKKYYDYLLESYVTASRKITWCPTQGCEYAVCSSDDGADTNKEVTCKCLHCFCLGCLTEAHAPIKCATVDEWMSETLVQSHNWLLAKARPCPSCGKLIEETSCQRYSQCTLCDDQFNDNAVSAGEQPYDMFAPDDEVAEPSVDDNSYPKELAKSSLERYHKYYEGWSRSESSRLNALTELAVLKEIRLKILCELLDLSEAELDFLVEAHIQVASYWRLVKWIHAYGYYIPQEEILKKNLFDFLLEQGVKLVKMIEKHADELVQGVLEATTSSTEYYEIRRKIICLTRVTRVYFERLVEAFKDDLAEVVSVSRLSSGTKTGEASCSNPSQGSSPPCKYMKIDETETNNFQL